MSMHGEEQPPVDASGDPVAREVQARLDELDSLPVDEHVAVYEAVHRTLRGALSDVARPESPSVG